MKRRGVKYLFWETNLYPYKTLVGKDALCSLEKGGIQKVLVDKPSKRRGRFVVWKKLWVFAVVVGMYFLAMSYPMKPVGFLPFPTGYPRANLR